jgi:hypothetical protein
MPRTGQTQDRSDEQRDVKFSLPIARIWGRKRLEYYAFLGSEDIDRKLLGVLVVVLRGDPIAGPGFSLGRP